MYSSISVLFGSKLSRICDPIPLRHASKLEGQNSETGTLLVISSKMLTNLAEMFQSSWWKTLCMKMNSVVYVVEFFEHWKFSKILIIIPDNLPEGTTVFHESSQIFIFESVKGSQSPFVFNFHFHQFFIIFKILFIWYVTISFPRCL